eukprot:6336406-Pyramimonas_sp.AAC.1
MGIHWSTRRVHARVLEDAIARPPWNSPEPAPGPSCPPEAPCQGIQAGRFADAVRSIRPKGLDWATQNWSAIPPRPAPL